ncbi:MAG: dihydroorotate dehydrogenase electron transfer subunit [Chloroflexota bacterium]
MKQVTARVISNQKVMPDASLMWLEAPAIAESAQAGQFVLVQTGENFLPRPVSIHQKKDSQIALLIRVTGSGMEWLSVRSVGEAIRLTGTLGNGFSIKPNAKNLLLVAGGMGIAPLIFLAKQAVNKGLSVTLLYGTVNTNRYPDRMVPSQIKVIAATEDGSVGQKGLVTSLIPDYIDKADQVFACGPLAMYKDLAKRKTELLKNKPCQISLEMRMACGHGVCYGCTIETKKGLKQVCKDGPVFELDDVENLLKDDALCLRWLTV